ncbi:MAG: PorV/PorQ family protein [Gemmatimonadota bacterium]|nr:PorV/PorQ family protein [Gemmatimonadota bacterium]
MKHGSYIAKKAMVLLAAAILFLTPQGAAAISADAGTTSLNFLKVGVGARAAAMAGAFSAVSDDASACFWNPAGLVDSRPRELFFMHHRFIADISQSAAGFTFDVPRGVRMGVSMNYYSMGELERRASNTTLPEGTFSPSDVALGLSAAYRVNEKISAGVTARFVHENIDSETAQAMLFDIGIKAGTMIQGLSAALTVRNLGTQLKYDAKGYDAPRLVSVGASYVVQKLPWSHSALTLNAEITAPNDNDTRFAVGGEYIFKEFLIGRLGYRSGLDRENVSFGFGINYMNLRFDYGFVPYTDLGNSHRFSFIYGF